MKKVLVTLLYVTCLASYAGAQRKCGFEYVRSSLIAKDPAWTQIYERQRAGLQAAADSYKQQKAGGAFKTTTASAIPVIFHFLLTADQFAQIGGDAGIQQRIDSQIAVLNRDYNKANPDSALIPANWKPLWGNTGIHFGLAHTNPMGYGTPGYDVQIIPNTPGGYSSVWNGYSDAKHNSTGGQDAWDVTKYINIWCMNFTDIGGLLGLTVSKSQTPGGFPTNEMGLCINYAAVGKRVSSTDYYIPTGYLTDYYDMGRTITHEMGHFLEIWHTWGDDAGQCPWSGGSDDGIADTPPEKDHKFYANAYDIPGGTYKDSCHLNGSTETQPIGVASLDFMNYTDDIAMQLFTPDQAAAMASQVAVSGEHYSLTQHPDLLNWGPVAVQDVHAESSLSIYPNPANGVVNISFAPGTDELQNISVVNLLGQEVHNDSGSKGQYIYTIDLSAMSKGVYFIRCTFASGSTTRKIRLQ